MKYEQLKYISKNEAEIILLANKKEELLLLPLSLGEYCEEPEYAQKICIDLANKEDPDIKTNAILGLSYIARKHAFLEKKNVESTICAVLGSPLSINSVYRVIEAAEDIYLFMKWRKGLKYIFMKFLLIVKWKIRTTAK